MADLRGWDSLVLPGAIPKFPCEDPSSPHAFWAFLERFSYGTLEESTG